MVSTPTREQLEADLDELGTSVARFAVENSYLRHSGTKSFKRLVKLEAAIRTHVTGGCACRTDRECLAKLYKLVPTKPRARRRP